MLAEGAGSEDSSEAEDSGELGGKSQGRPGDPWLSGMGVWVLLFKHPRAGPSSSRLEARVCPGATF